jgi:hypothetical protein
MLNCSFQVPSYAHVTAHCLQAMDFLSITDTGMTLTADGREKLKDAKIASLKKMEAEVGVVAVVSDAVHH